MKNIKLFNIFPNYARNIMEEYVPKQCKTNIYFKTILIINYKTQTLMNKEIQTPSNIHYSFTSV